MQAARPALLLLLTVPFTAHAVPITDNMLVVDYEGTITETRDAPPEYVVGNPIAGRLLIDRSLAIDVLHLPNRALYQSADPAFVSGFWPSSGDGFDEISISTGVARQGDAGLIDIFSVDDLLVGRNAPLDNAMVFGVSAGVRGFLDDVSLEQNFVLTRADADEPEEFLGGSIRFSQFGPFPFVSFILDRLSVKPGRCVAP